MDVKMSLFWVLLFFVIKPFSAERIMCVLEVYDNTSFTCNVLSARIEDDNYTFNELMNYDVKLCSFYNSVVPKIPTKFFNEFQNLEQLKMEITELSVIQQNAFVGAKKLRVFNGVSNMLSKLEADSFGGAELLESCLLHSNLISFVDENAFRHLNSLKRIYLSKNRIETLSENTFLGLKSLELISLHTNQIKSINYDLFRDNLNLKIIYLARNKIDVLSERLFCNSSNLMKVDLSWNICINKTFYQNEIDLLNEGIAECLEENTFESRIQKMKLELEICSGNIDKWTLFRQSNSSNDLFVHSSLLIINFILLNILLLV